MPYPPFPYPSPSHLAQKSAARRKEYFVRAEKYVKQYRTEKRQLIEAKRAAKAEGNFFVEAQPKIAVVTRIRGYALFTLCLPLPLPNEILIFSCSILGVSPKPRKILQLLRLRQINNTVFVRLNKATLAMLKLVEPYIAWGYAFPPLLHFTSHLLSNVQPFSSSALP